ncbi:NTF2 fold immunity protein [Ideonella lacteola]|uniref:NTF2 fold immunity protein n=1 Tax=Ideonella lacteola TaxID=2984193 RepID=UPI003BF943F5
MRVATFCLVLTLCSEVAAAQSTSQHNYKPVAGYVPNAATAIRIAVAVWTPIYGEKQVAEQAPYNAELIEGVWHVTGSLG